MTARRVGESPALLGPLDALGAAVDRARAELPRRGDPLDAVRRERLELAAADVVRALVWARRQLRDRERDAAEALDAVARVLGAARLDALELGVSGRILGLAG